MGWLSRLLKRGHEDPELFTRRVQGPQPAETAPPAQHSDTLSLLALEPRKREEFLRRIVGDGAWILAMAPDSECGVETPNVFLAHIERQVRELSQDRFGRPFTYSLKGSIVLPVFSTVEAAQEFIKRLKITGAAVAFQCLQVLAGFWVGNDFELTRVIFNPSSNCQTEFSESELKQMKLFASEDAQ